MNNIRKKNMQGFIVIGMDFDTNYGKDIPACFQFEFRGYEISVSTGAVQPSIGNTDRFPQSIIVTDLGNGKEVYLNCTVEEAIQHVIAFSVFDGFKAG